VRDEIGFPESLLSLWGVQAPSHLPGYHGVTEWMSVLLRLPKSRLSWLDSAFILDGDAEHIQDDQVREDKEDADQHAAGFYDPCKAAPVRVMTMMTSQNSPK
jgi:hypothetical protein